MLAIAMTGFGGFGDAGGVSQLQKALIAYAQNTKDPAANPGPADGTLSNWTVLATINVVWKAAGQVPGLKDLKDQITGIPGLGDVINDLLGNPTVTLLAWSAAQTFSPNTTDAIKNFIDAHASTLASGVSIAAGMGVGPPPPIGPPTPDLTSILHSTIQVGIGSRAPSAAGKYKKGSIARFNTSRKVWSVYSPLAGAGLFGLSVSSEGRCMGGDCLGAAAAVTPPVPVGFVKTGEELTPPAGVAQTGAEADASLFSNPMFWLAVGGGAVVLGTGGYFLLRKKK